MTYIKPLKLLSLTFPIASIMLSACQNPPSAPTQRQSADTQSVDAQEQVAQTATEDIANEGHANERQPAVTTEPQATEWQYDISQLLFEAEAALAADKLTTPIEDNAFDRFNAVLILRPGNETALNGLHEIFTRYVLLAQDAMRSGEYGKARALVERARSVNSESPTLANLAEELRKKEREYVRAQPQLEISPNQKEIKLNVEGLNRRDDVMVEQLQGLAVQVRDSDEILLIEARSDSEGRWIYQRMAEGVPGYRLRGDIRLGRTPKVLLLPAIE
jgi:hypothetical protein